ncbi:hypothetical protein ACFLQ5_03005 [Bacteroidota bacterium]
MNRIFITIVLVIIFKLAICQTPMSGTYIIGGPQGVYSDLDLAAVQVTDLVLENLEQAENE